MGEPAVHQASHRRTLDLLGGDGHQKVVAPGTVDVEITLEQAFLPKTHFCQHPATGRVLRTTVASTRCNITGPKQWSKPSANAPVATPRPVTSLATQYPIHAERRAP